MQERPRYTYHFSQEYGTMQLRMILGSRGEYVEEVHLAGAEAQELYDSLMVLCPDYALRHTIAQQDDRIRAIIAPYFESQGE